MTIQFQGHVKSIEGGVDNTTRVTLCTPMKKADGAEWVIYIPLEQTAHWLPGRTVSFTIYTLPEKTGLSVTEALGRVTSGRSGEGSMTKHRLTDADIDRIFDAYQEAPTMSFRYLVARAIEAELLARAQLPQPEPDTVRVPRIWSDEDAVRVAHAAGFSGTCWTVGPEELSHLLNMVASAPKE